ncbi:hypothetical protein D3C73_385200 [compost metagenome]
MSFLSGTVPERQYFQGEKVFGPTFNDELEASGGLVPGHYTQISPGLQGSPVTIEFFEDTPPDVIDGVLAVYDAHDPTKVPQTQQH